MYKTFIFNIISSTRKEFFSLNLETRNLSITAFSRYFVDAKIPKIVKPSRKF